MDLIGLGLFMIALCVAAYLRGYRIGKEDAQKVQEKK